MAEKWWVIFAIPLVIVFFRFLEGDRKLNDLKKRFPGAGVLTGKTKSEIIKLAGEPTSVSSLPDGQYLLQWIRTGPTGSYHIALLFNSSDICEGITSEQEAKNEA